MRAKQVLAAAVDDVQVLALLGGQGIVALHQLGEPDDGVDRRPDLVGHVGQERALGAVGRVGGLLRVLELPRPLPDERLEIFPALQQLFLGQLADRDVPGDPEGGLPPLNLTGIGADLDGTRRRPCV